MRVRTGNSFKLAAGHLADVMSRIVEIGLKAAPISDRLSEFGFVEWTKLCKKNNVKPIYGVELAVSEDPFVSKPIVDYWTFFAKDNLRSINDLVWQATIDVSKDGKKIPCLTYEEAQFADGVIKIAGEKSRINLIEPDDDLFVGLSPSVSRGYFKEVNRQNLQWIATSDNYYPRKEDKEFYRVLLGRNANTQTWPMHILHKVEWTSFMSHVATNEAMTEALRNQQAAMDACNAVLEKADVLIPHKDKTLRQMCEEGAKIIGVDLIRDQTYANRLDHELSMIAEKKFEDYFYIIADMVAFAKTKMIVGPARGSSCGSLVCYLLGITTIDPLKYNLLFERFIDASRPDLPDIDIDFSDVRRSMVFEYAEQKYGRDHVARLGNVNSFQPKSALNQVGYALRIPQWKIDRLGDSIIKRAQGDSRASQTIEDTLHNTDMGKELVKDYPEIVMVARMEDHPANAGQHAAGVVLTERSIKDHIAVDARTGAVMADKKDAEELNLLKIDALGLTQLSVFERTLELIGIPSKSGWLEKLPLDDPAAFEVLNKGHFAGVFQFIGHTVQSIVKEIKVDCLNDLVAIGALARPGPVGSGGTDQWVARRSGRSKVEYATPLFEPYLGDTLGVIVYQEQVMQICRELGDMSWNDVNFLRRAMSKSLGKEVFDKYGDSFKVGLAKRGVPEDKLERIWSDLCSFGAMGFNQSHSVAYGVISYWCCYLKAHHPLEFAAASLDAESDPARQIKTLRELKSEGMDYISVDAELSTDRWQPAERDGKKFLVGPLTSIVGVGPKTVEEILECRRTGKDIRPKLLEKIKTAKTSIDSLYPVQDEVKRLHPDLAQVKILTPPTNIIDVQTGRTSEVVVIGVVDKINPSDDNFPVKIAKRNGKKVSGPSMALNLFVRDDTDETLCRIDRRLYETIGKPIVERGRSGKAIYAFKGSVPENFRMIQVKAVKYLGEL